LANITGIPGVQCQINIITKLKDKEKRPDYYDIYEHRNIQQDWKKTHRRKTHPEIKEQDKD
jgi:hypothetical protein